MALGAFMTRKWIKPFLAFFLLTIVSLLAFGNITSRISWNVVYVKSAGTSPDPSARHSLGLAEVEQIMAVSSGAALSSPPDRRSTTATPPPQQQTTEIRAMTKDGDALPGHLNLSAFYNVSKEVKRVLSVNHANISPALIHKHSGLSVSLNENHLASNSSDSSSDFSSSSSAAATSSINISVIHEAIDHSGPFYNGNGSNDRTESAVKQQKGTTKPVFIILLARMRTGSTLIGEIFNQNLEVGFLYEPLHALCDWTKRGLIQKSQYNSQATNLLRKLSSCDFPRDFISSVVNWPAGGGFRSSMIHPVCAATSSCRHATTQMLRRRCLTFHKYRSIKTIRADFSMVSKIIDEGAVDVKILHLVRDPRGVANSRRGVYSTERTSTQRRLAARRYRTRIIHDRAANPFHRPDVKAFPAFSSRYQRFRPHPGQTRLDALGLMDTADVFPLLNTMPAYCKWLKSTITLAQQKPHWLRGRYKLIRYEDYAAAPVRVTEDIYRYFGMQLPENVYDWVATNTKTDQTDAKNDDVGRLYGSHRNSTETAFKWRKEMTSQEALQIEKLCGDVMERLGYRRTSRNIRLSDLKQSLFLPLPDDIPQEL